MRILFITSTLEPKSGWGTHSRNTVQGALEHGHTALVLVQEASASAFCEERCVLPNPVHVLSSRIASMQTSWQIARAVREWKPDIVHVLVEPFAIALPFAAKLCSMPPWILNLHGTYSVTPFLRDSTKARMARAWLECSAFLVCSRFTKTRAIEAANRVSPRLALHIEQKAHMFHFGISPGTFVATTPKKHGTASILFVGALKPRKGVLEVLKACNEFQKHSSQKIHVHLVGDCFTGDAYIHELQTFVRSAGMENDVTFHGRLSEAVLQELYKTSDLFMMLSKEYHHHFEGFGLVFLEANSYGIPTIGSINSGCAEAIHEGVSGYTVDPDDAHAAAERMKWIVVEGRIKREDCRAWADKHNLEQQADSVEACYQSLR